MTRVRRSGYVFVRWAGDHSPRHVHVYADGRLIGRWDLENDCPMDAPPLPRRVVDVIHELQREGRL